MISIVGVFERPNYAQAALRYLRILGLDRHRATLAGPANAAELAGVPLDASEQPGMAGTFAALLGGGIGLAAGLAFGCALANTILPGSAAVTVGSLAGIALGLSGAIAGSACGALVDRAAQDGLPSDELFIYEDALRQGRSTLTCFADTELEGEEMRRALEHADAESIDWARHCPWAGLQDVERLHYVPPAPELRRPPDHFRKGLEASVEPEFSGKPWDQVVYRLAEEYRDWYEPAFRDGFDRGQHIRN
ncbi:MAG TPA: hypothetical protein VML19_22875 [Verrucomicrobiae bacterium]|nr:hypothetical protein [Verrucomicrobiae bacterium]